MIRNLSELSELGVSTVNTPLTLSHSRKRRWRILILVLVSVALIAFHAPILQRMAIYLITEDPPRKAAAIVALRGQVPFRELEAAKYYRDGFAPIVILVPSKAREENRALDRLGVKVTQDWQYGREVLVKQGVPPAAIVIAKGEGEGTLEELRAAYEALVSQRSEVGDQRPALSKVEGSAVMPVDSGHFQISHAPHAADLALCVRWPFASDRPRGKRRSVRSRPLVAHAALRVVRRPRISRVGELLCGVPSNAVGRYCQRSAGRGKGYATELS